MVEIPSVGKAQGWSSKGTPAVEWHVVGAGVGGGVHECREDNEGTGCRGEAGEEGWLVESLALWLEEMMATRN